MISNPAPARHRSFSTLFGAGAAKARVAEHGHEQVEASLVRGRWERVPDAEAASPINSRPSDGPAVYF